MRLTVKIRESKAGKSRFFVNISKKKVSKAVDRNRLKRRIREILRKRAEKGRDYLVIYNSSEPDISYQELEKEINLCISSK